MSLPGYTPCGYFIEAGTSPIPWQNIFVQVSIHGTGHVTFPACNYEYSFSAGGSFTFTRMIYDGVTPIPEHEFTIERPGCCDGCYGIFLIDFEGQFNVDPFGTITYENDVGLGCTSSGDSNLVFIFECPEGPGCGDFDCVNRRLGFRIFVNPPDFSPCGCINAAGPVLTSSDGYIPFEGVNYFESVDNGQGVITEFTVIAS